MLKRRAIPTTSPEVNRPITRASRASTAASTRQTSTPEPSTSTSTRQHAPRRQEKSTRTTRRMLPRESPVVDLTAAQESATGSSSFNTKFKSTPGPLSTITAERPSKRQRTSVPPQGKPAVIKNQNTNGTEEIDLTDADDDVSLSNLLRKNQEELLRAQNPTPEKRKLGNFDCVICLDRPKDLVATPCGHMFCDLCLRGALRAGPNPNQKHGRCPMCRSKVMHKDVVLMEIKRISKSESKGKMKAR